MINFIGYAGVLIIGLSLIQKQRIFLHLLNAVGSAIMGVYAVLIKDLPFLILEIGIVALNMFYWFKIKKEEVHGKDKHR